MARLRKLEEVSVPPAPTVAGRRECLEELLLDDLEVMDRHPLVTLRITWLSGMSALLAGLPKHRAPAWFQYVLGRMSRHSILMRSGVDRALACWVEWQLNQRERFQHGSQ